MRTSMLWAAVFTSIAANVAVAGPLSPRTDGRVEPYFYNRPSVTVQELSDDVAECEGVGRGIFGAGNGGLLPTMINGGAVASFTDDCMMARGYRRFQTDDRNQRAFWRRVETMSDGVWATLISAETPSEGVLVREWSNSFALDARENATPWSRRFVDPGFRRSIVSSLVGFGSVSSNTHVGVQRLDRAVSLGPDEALVLITIHRDGESRWPARIEFGPVGALNPADSRSTGSRPGIEVELGVREMSQQLAFVVPAGAYALNEAGANRARTEFCLGTAGFEVAPGDVLYLGDVAIQPAQRTFAHAPPAAYAIGISQAGIEDARALLAASPELAPRLRGADYVNGVQWLCDAMTAAAAYGPIYGFDLPGAPWVGETQPVQSQPIAEPPAQQ